MRYSHACGRNHRFGRAHPGHYCQAVQALCGEPGLPAVSARPDYGEQVARGALRLDGKLIDFGKQKEVPVRDLIHEYLDFIEDVVDELDSREELNYLRQILETGSGADRQLRVFQETGDLKKVVEYMIAETEAGLTESVASARKVG